MDRALVQVAGCVPCDDEDDCDRVFVLDGFVYSQAEEVTDPALLAQVRLGPGEKLFRQSIPVYLDGADAVRRLQPAAEGGQA